MSRSSQDWIGLVSNNELSLTEGDPLDPESIVTLAEALMVITVIVPPWHRLSLYCGVNTGTVLPALPQPTAV